MKVLVADDHALMREGLQIVLARLDGDLQIIEAIGFEDVLRKLKSCGEIDLALIDLAMPDDDPFIGLKRVLDATLDIPTVVLSASENPADMHHSIALGAKGFIPKSASSEVLLSALELVLSGSTYLPTQLFGYTGDTNKATIGSSASEISITRRQREVLNLLSQGQTNKGIGRTLGLSEGTVRTHVAAIFKILDVNNRTQASKRAQELALLDRDA